MSLYTSLVSKILFPVHERLKGHSSVVLRRQMEKSQWWTPEKLEALQLERLRALLKSAVEHVPYYRKLLGDLELDPESFTSLGDLQRIPFLTKAVIRAHTEALKADDAQGLGRFNTGGSTGEPLIFYIGKERTSHDVAAKWRATRWWGLDIGDREIVVWGSPVELGVQDRVREIRDRLMRTSLLPAFEMSESNLDRFVAAIRDFRPRMLFGYPSALSLIGQHAEKRGIALNDLGIRLAFVTAERLYPHQRETIERIYGCRVANGYGARDAGFIAHQCPEGGMHITAEDIIVEIIDSEGRAVPPGQAGEVVVTHLATKDFPFIRYRTGDVAVLDPEPCGCGRGLPLIKEVQGRTTDFIVLPDGTIMHGLALIYILRDLPGIESFKIVQERIDALRILIIPGEGFGEETEAQIVAGMKERVGEDVAVALEKVESIAPERSGKFRYVVSKVAPQGT